MPIPYTTSENNELLRGGSHCPKSLVICDSRFESQIAIAIKSRDLEHLAPVYKLPGGAIYKPPCVQLINNPCFAIHQVFALLV